MNRPHRDSVRLVVMTWAALSSVADAAAPPAYKTTILHPLAGNTVSNANGVDGNFQVGDGYGPSTGNNYHALLWNNTAASVVDLTPPGFTYAIADGIQGNTQVGYGQANPTSTHALLWHGTAARHPAGFQHSSAHGIDGNSQVGKGTPIDSQDWQALLWHGTAASAISLHPPGFKHSEAHDVQGNTQVGWGFIQQSFDLHTHALMWHGTAASIIDLHPPTGYEHSLVYEVDGNNQIGNGQLQLSGGPTHALLWHGSANNYTNLHPAGFDSSVGLGLSGDQQVGFGYLAGTTTYHALSWNGTAGSVVDLHQYLTGLSVTLVNSFASSIDANGYIVGRPALSLRADLRWHR
jgi:hypothetical protein